MPIKLTFLNRVTHCFRRDAPSLEAALASFTNYLRVQQGMGEVTVGGYYRMVKKFLREVGTTKPSEQQAVDYLAQLHVHNASYSHIRNSTRALYLYFLLQGRDLSVSYPKKPKRIIREILTPAEVSSLIAAAAQARDRLFLTFMAYSGCRYLELRHLKAGDIHFRDGTVLIRSGKGFQDRRIDLPPELFQLLESYSTTNGKRPDDYLLGDGRPISAKYIRRVLRDVQAKTGIRKHLHPHLFRHSLATNMLANGADLVTIQQHLGHSDIKSTMIYINYTRSLYRQQYQRFAPDYANPITPNVIQFPAAQEQA